MDPDKASARVRLHQLLRATTADQRAEWAASLRAHVENSGLWRAARKVMVFAALRYEPDLLPLLQTEKRFVFPSLESDLIVPRAVADSRQLRTSALGIREPDPAECPVEADFDLVLVPGLGFGRDGSRLGRGRGHYDRFLAGLHAGVKRWGVCFHCQLNETLPAEDHDVRMHATVTEQGWIFPEAAPARQESA